MTAFIIRTPGGKAAAAAVLLLLPLMGFGAETINDVTQINPIVMDEVVAPRTMAELVAAVTSHSGPVSIGGGRFSMGGQTATEHGVQIDMRKFNQVVTFSPEQKEITVQAGITWRAIQEFIDSSDLSLKTMQTYANFTVGGALSVNAHGRYIGLGPLVLSVKSIKLVLANGDVVVASPTEHSDMFYGAIGGYGSLGVIAEATLSLADNVRVERKTVVMPLTSYWRYFTANVRENPDVIFHNADIYPNAFDTVRVSSYIKTDKAVTVPDRLMPADRDYSVNRHVYQVISEWPGGKWLRQHVVDPVYFMGDRIEWRNYEASYDVRELEPASRKQSTYVLQEYFIPVEKLDSFVPKMGEILNSHDVNVINISIRHARPDSGTALAWARNEVFAFVLYYKQGTGEADRREVGVWTRELIDAAISYGGAYYLPYQIVATPQQFHSAYPRAWELFVLKHQVDPGNKFRNKLWDAYYQPVTEVPAVAASAGELSMASLRKMTGYRRDEAQTYLTLPEWVLVYSPAEYATSLRQNPPSRFPYFRSIGQFWGYYHDAWAATRKDYPVNWRYHLMVAVIGTSYTIENAVKGVYENTIGRITEFTASNQATAEDVAAAAFAQHYVDFIRVRPWYEFPFLSELKKLWRDTPLLGKHVLRKWERRFILSAELLVKAQYAALLTLATHAAYGVADREVIAVATGATPATLAKTVGVGVLATLEGGDLALKLPRYEAFRDAVIELSNGGVQFKELAGNTHILMTVVVPSGWHNQETDGQEVFSRTILTDTHYKRVGVVVPVTSLHKVVGSIQSQGLAIEHLYDY